jgi:hypothetical protein
MAILRPLPERLSLESLAKRWGYDLENEVGVFFQDIASHCASGHLSLFSLYRGWAIEIKDYRLHHDAAYKNQRYRETGLGRGDYKSRFKFDELESGARPVRMCQHIEIPGLSGLVRYYDIENKARLRTQFGYFKIEVKNYVPLDIDFSSSDLSRVLTSRVSKAEQPKLDHTSSFFSLAVINVDLDKIDVLGAEVQRLEDGSPAKASKKELWDMYGWYDDEIVDEDELEEYERLTVTGQHNGGSNNKPMVEQRMPFFEKLADEKGGIEQITQYKKDDIWEVLQKRNPELFDKGYDDFFGALNEKGIKFKNGRKGNSYIPIADK